MTDAISTTEELLFRDLVSGLSVPGGDQTLSIGIVGNARHRPQPPRHCLRACLNGDPRKLTTHACPFLAKAAQNELDRACLREDGRCPKGFQVEAQATVIGRAPAMLVTVEGRLETAPEEGGTDLAAHLESAEQLVQRVDQLLEENAGFANEVLQNYEQLNLIFDLTQQVAQVTEAQAVEKLLLQRVATLLALESVCVFTTEGECRVYGDRGDPDASSTPGVDGPAAAKVVAAVRASRQVQVSYLGDRQVIAAPLVRLDDKVDVALAVRPAGASPFNAGDMMLTESLLTFGGQIISNTELHERLRRMSLEVTRAMVAAIDKKDHYTSGHSERCGFLTRLIAEELGVPPAERQIMELAGLLHDVGKIGIPEDILCKPGKLTREEFEAIKQHPRMGYEILKPIASLGVILDGVLYHHEYPDGSGYPEGLKGDAIPLVARIIHVADTFDALTSTRAYRQAFSLERAFEIIREDEGRRIDPAAAQAFFSAFRRYRREQPEDFQIRFAKLHQQEAQYA